MIPHRYLGVEMPLDMVADEPRMWSFAGRRAAEQARAWNVNVEQVQVHWGLRAATSTADEDGRVRTTPWEPGTPVPPWAYTLLLVVMVPDESPTPTG